VTQVINLYGGPGTGKSTSAALLFAMLKMAGKNAELVREYVKEWAWEGRQPGEFDQLYFMGKQIRKESLLYGKVDWIVTDSPVLLGVYYSQEYAPELIAEAVKKTATNFYDHAHRAKVVHHHVFLERSKQYNPAGRYQTEEEAKKIDVSLRRILARHDGDYIKCGTHPTELLDMLLQISKDDVMFGNIIDILDETVTGIGG
jgi:hypothetical protein